MTYKPNVADTRESRALDILNSLRKIEGVEVDFYDQFAHPGGDSLDNMVDKCDVVAILVAHDGVDYDLIGRKAKVIVDTTNVMEGREIAGDVKL